MVYDQRVNLKIPTDYQILNIEDIIDFKKGIEPTSKEYIESPENTTNLTKFYRVGDFVDDSSTTYIKDELAKIKCDFYDVLISFDGSIGKVSCGIKGSFSSGIQKAVFKDKRIDNSLIYGILTDERIQKTLKCGSNSGSILKHASSLKKYIWVPYNYNDYSKAAITIKPYFEEIIKLKVENNLLHQIKSDILLKFIK